MERLGNSSPLESSSRKKKPRAVLKKQPRMIISAYAIATSMKSTNAVVTQDTKLLETRTMDKKNIFEVERCPNHGRYVFC